MCLFLSYVLLNDYLLKGVGVYSRLFAVRYAYAVVSNIYLNTLVYL